LLPLAFRLVETGPPGCKPGALPAELRARKKTDAQTRSSKFHERL